MFALFEGGEEETVGRLAGAHGLTLVGFGLDVSMDELAIGLSVRPLRFSILAAAVIIAARAFIVTQ